MQQGYLRKPIHTLCCLVIVYLDKDFKKVLLNQPAGLVFCFEKNAHVPHEVGGIKVFTNAVVQFVVNLHFIIFDLNLKTQIIHLPRETGGEFAQHQVVRGEQSNRLVLKKLLNKRDRTGLFVF